MLIYIIIIIIVILIIWYNIQSNQIINIKKIKNFKNDNCYLYDNINRNQLLYKKLMDAMEYLSKKREIKLKDEVNRTVFIQGTFTDILKREIGEITDLILNKLNHRTGFYFKTIDYDNIIEIVDKFGNKNFDFHVFVQDPQEHLAIRLHINVIKYIFQPFQHKKYLTCAKATTPEFPTYEIGYPRPDQFLPLPTEVITTGGNTVLSEKGINMPVSAPIRYLFINKIEVYNNNWILDPDTKCPPINPLSGYYDIPFDHTIYNGPSTPFQEPNCIANRWITPPDKPDNSKIWNCAYQPLEWDDKGILVSSCKNKPACTGYQTSTEQIPPRPEYWPTNSTIPRHSGPYAWLFDLVRGDPSINTADFSDYT
jgi:hypothetical protein